MDPSGCRWIKLRMINMSGIILHFLNILMKLNHLIVHLFNSNFFIKGDRLWNNNLFLLVGCFLFRWLVLKVNIAIFDELLSEFTHTFCIFWFWVISDDARSSFGFVDLILWYDLRLGVYFRWVKNVSSGFVWVWKNTTLKHIVGTFLCLEDRPCISLEM